MRKIILALAALAAFCATSASAQLVISRSQSGAVGNVVTATDPSGVSGKVVLQSVTMADSTGTTVSPSVAPVAAGTSSAGNPTPAGCDYNSTLPTYTTGQRAQVQCDNRGSINVSLTQQGTAVGTISGASDSYAPGNIGLSVGTTGRVFNGASWDRAFTCANTAQVSVTGGATTQIVALSGSTVIRVCSVALSMSAAGTVQWSYGTGTNCATGPTAIMAAMNLATGMPWALSAPTGGSLFRSAAGNALCLAAVTGNATGFITYAQY